LSSAERVAASGAGADELAELASGVEGLDLPMS
jgi:hypothetical protein